MVTSIDLTSASNPILNFKTWYDIEEGWDFASIQVRKAGTDTWTAIEGNITTTDHNPDAEVQVEYGITGNSNGWIDGVFDLSTFCGKNIELKFEYDTDAAVYGQGFYVDDIEIIDNGNILLSDNADSDEMFTLNGFSKDEGIEYIPNYYLVEWRDHSGVDTSLAHINRLGTLISYDPGMVVWYVNERYDDNWGAVHPGAGFLSIVDADQRNVRWINKDITTSFASNSYQMHDAAFSMWFGSGFIVDASETYGRIAVDFCRRINRTFKDTADYTNSEIPTLGTILPELGLNIQIVKQKLDNSSATVKLSIRQ